MMRLFVLNNVWENYPSKDYFIFVRVEIGDDKDIGGPI